MHVLRPGASGDDASPKASERLQEPPRIGWTRIVAISIFALALNLQWAALSAIILPSQVFKMVGDQNKGTALAFVLIPGAFVSLFANPLFGWLSDRTRGRWATWGRRRPYILLGTLGSVATLCWMASAQDVLSLACAYIFVQFFSNIAQAPFHALLPDIVPPKQRGITSGVIGLMTIAGNIGGVLVAGLLINSAQPLPLYRQGLWLTYGIIIVVLLLLMLVTLLIVREQAIPTIEQQVQKKSARRPWWSYPATRTLAIALLAALLTWGSMTLWNTEHITGIVINSDIEQVVIEIIITLGILRLFDFHPRRDPDFAWVLVTRMVMMLGIYTIQNFLQYYMRDVVKVAHPEQETTNFLIIVSLTSLVSALSAGWLSDHFGRKRLVYISGALMAVVGVVFVITHSLPLVITAGAIFGLGYGAYQSVDWALVADVLPSAKSYARDMGVWNVALSLSQVIAPVLGGPLLDTFTRAGNPVLGYQVIFTMSIIYCIIGTVTVRFIRGASN
jgi:MFS family permease